MRQNMNTIVLFEDGINRGANEREALDRRQCEDALKSRLAPEINTAVCLINPEIH